MRKRSKLLVILLGLVFLALATPRAEAQSACPLTLTPDPDELAGVVTGVGSSSFDLDVNGEIKTINVDSSTQYEGLAGLSELEVGDLARVSVEVQPDTSLLAEEVELLFDEDEETGVTGRIACVQPPSPILVACPITGCPGSTAIDLVFAPSTPDNVFPALTLRVLLQLEPVSYKVNAGNLNTSGFAFDDYHLAVGQRVTAAGTPFTGGDVVELQASKVILKLQEFEGTVVEGSVDLTGGTFQINITSPSNALLTTPLTVKTSLMTRFGGRLRDLSGLNTTDTYRIRGLLMLDKATWDPTAQVTLLAKSVKRMRLLIPPS